MPRKKVIEPTLEEHIRLALSYDHMISVYQWCSFGDHWECSCGVKDLDSPAGHLAKVVTELVEKYYINIISNNP